MIGVDIYRPDHWHDFFVMVGGASTALKGQYLWRCRLIWLIAQDATHRYRAVGTLAGFTAAFLICCLCSGWSKSPGSRN